MTAEPPLTLAQTQRWLLAVITHPESAEAGVRCQAGLLAPSQLTTLVDGDAARPALERLAIYQEAYFSRLEECLSDDYQALRAALGSDAFAVLCRDFVHAHPPTGPSLNHYGKTLAEYLSSRPTAYEAWHAELARLEWSIVEVIHAATEEPVSVAALARIAPSQLPVVQLRAASAVRLLSFRFDVNAYLQAVLDERSPEPPAAAATHVLLIRHDTRMRRLELPAAQARVLRRLLAGEALGSALADVGDTEPEVVQAWFRDWMTLGIFADVSAPSTGTPQP
jgi:hypothetical protein